MHIQGTAAGGVSPEHLAIQRRTLLSQALSERDGRARLTAISSLRVVDEATISPEARRALRGQQDKLSPEDKRQLAQLKKQDREVRAHERAHKAAAGGLPTSGPSFVTERGPDGKLYAVEGEVRISIPRGGTPDQTIRNARQAQRAASAPHEPSGQDRKVAARAKQMENEAIETKRKDDASEDPPGSELAGANLQALSSRLNLLA